MPCTQIGEELQPNPKCPAAFLQTKKERPSPAWAGPVKEPQHRPKPKRNQDPLFLNSTLNSANIQAALISWKTGLIHCRTHR